MSSFMSNSFQVPNAIIDQHLGKDLDVQELGVLMVIIRKTKGWHKDVDGISISQFRKFSGIKSKATIIKRIRQLEDKGFIHKTRTYRPNGGYNYSLYSLGEKVLSPKSNQADRSCSANEQGVVYKMNKGLPAKQARSAEQIKETKTNAEKEVVHEMNKGKTKNIKASAEQPLVQQIDKGLSTKQTRAGSSAEQTKDIQTKNTIIKERKKENSVKSSKNGESKAKHQPSVHFLSFCEKIKEQFPPRKGASRSKWTKKACHYLNQLNQAELKQLYLAVRKYSQSNDIEEGYIMHPQTFLDPNKETWKSWIPQTPAVKNTARQILQQQQRQAEEQKKLFQEKCQKLTTVYFEK